MCMMCRSHGKAQTIEWVSRDRFQIETRGRLLCLLSRTLRTLGICASRTSVWDPNMGIADCVSGTHLRLHGLYTQIFLENLCIEAHIVPHLHTGRKQTKE